MFTVETKNRKGRKELIFRTLFDAFCLRKNSHQDSLPFVLGNGFVRLDFPLAQLFIIAFAHIRDDLSHQMAIFREQL